MTFLAFAHKSAAIMYTSRAIAGTFTKHGVILEIAIRLPFSLESGHILFSRIRGFRSLYARYSLMIAYYNYFTTLIESTCVNCYIE